MLQRYIHNIWTLWNKSKIFPWHTLLKEKMYKNNTIFNLLYVQYIYFSIPGYMYSRPTFIELSSFIRYKYATDVRIPTSKGYWPREKCRNQSIALCNLSKYHYCSITNNVDGAYVIDIVPTIYTNYMKWEIKHSTKMVRWYIIYR